MCYVDDSGQRWFVTDKYGRWNKLSSGPIRLDQRDTLTIKLYSDICLSKFGGRFVCRKISLSNLNIYRSLCCPIKYCFFLEHRHFITNRITLSPSPTRLIFYLPIDIRLLINLCRALEIGKRYRSKEADKLFRIFCTSKSQLYALVPVVIY